MPISCFGGYLVRYVLVIEYDTVVDSRKAVFSFCLIRILITEYNLDGLTSPSTMKSPIILKLNRLIYDPGCSGDNGFDVDNGSRLLGKHFLFFSIKIRKKPMKMAVILKMFQMPSFDANLF